MKYLYPLTAIHADGDTVLLYSLEEVHKFISKYGRFYDYHWVSTIYGRFDEIHEWIVRDDFGKIVKFDDVCKKHEYAEYYNRRMANIRLAAEKGLPIPGTGGYRKCWKMNHTAKKNSGSGHRNRNRAKAIFEFEEYGVKNNVGNRVIPWENF